MVQQQLIFWRSNFTCLFCWVLCAIQRHSYINSWQIKSSARSERLCRVFALFHPEWHFIPEKARAASQHRTSGWQTQWSSAPANTLSVCFATICSPIRRKKNMFLGCQSSFLARGVWCDNAARLSWKVLISGPRMAKPKFLESERGERRFSCLFSLFAIFFS